MRFRITFFNGESIVKTDFDWHTLLRDMDTCLIMSIEVIEAGLA